jgi:1-acyl-sn-glycerol-3-phosphate acyltransferase
MGALSCAAMRTERDTPVERAVLDLCRSLQDEGAARPVALEASLSELGLDSLACAELAVALEDRFGVRLGGGDVEALRTVSDVILAVGSPRPGEERPALPRGIGRGQPLASALSGWAFRLQTGLRVEGQANVPATGPVLLAANHRSMMDVPVLALASPRPLVFMAKVELFRSRIGARFFGWLGGFPVRRDIPDLRAIDAGLAVLGKGGVLAVYPEGKRNFEGGLLPFLGGAAWMALRTGAPVVPTAITGTGRGTGSRRARVQFGPAIPVPRIGDVAERRRETPVLSARLHEAVRSLLD